MLKSTNPNKCHPIQPPYLLELRMLLIKKMKWHPSGSHPDSVHRVSSGVRVSQGSHNSLASCSDSESDSGIERLASFQVSK